MPHGYRPRLRAAPLSGPARRRISSFQARRGPSAASLSCVYPAIAARKPQSRWRPAALAESPQTPYLMGGCCLETAMDPALSSLIDRAGLDRGKVRRLIGHGLEGADDGELFLEYRQAEVLLFDNG